jgi:hypothetical protein
MAWIRIRMEPHSFSKLDPHPDSLSVKKLSPDPHNVKKDQKHCRRGISKNDDCISGKNV